VEAYLNTAKESSRSDLGTNPEGSGPPSSEKTTIAFIDKGKPPRIASTSDQLSQLSSTLDEESVDMAGAGLDGKTRINAPAEFEAYLKSKRQPKRKKALIFAISLVVLGSFIFLARKPIGQFLVGRDQTSITDPTTVADPNSEGAVLNTDIPPTISELPPTPVVVPTIPPTPQPVQVTQSPVPKDTPSSKDSVMRRTTVRTKTSTQAQISSITAEDASAFVKVTIKGTGDLSKHKVTRVMNPRRLIVEFPNIRSLQAKTSVSVSKNPLFRIRSSKGNNGIRVVLELYPVVFPKYEVKDRETSIEIFLHR
jgi:hypothetical protein